MSPDKYLHFAISFALTLALSFVIPMGYAVAVVLLISALKEWYDYRHPLKHTADWRDFAADVVGVVVAMLLLL